MELVPQVVGNRDYDSLSKIIFTVEQIVHIRELVPELIELGLISTYLRLLTDDNVLSNIDMLENMLAALLSIISREEGLDACEKDDCKIFTILCNVFMVKNTVIHTLIGGIMYLLINRYSMYQRAHEEKLD